MTAGVRVHTDRATYERWVRALAGLALPEELRPAGTGAPDPPDATVVAVPPLVAASLALHGWVEVAVTVRLTMPGGDTFGCFGLAGDLAAGLVRRADEVEIGLFGLGDLVEEVVRLVPIDPPAPGEAGTGCVRITVLGADAAVPGWQRILVGGESRWHRMQSGADPYRVVPVADVHRELAADLRYVITGLLTGRDRG